MRLPIRSVVCWRGGEKGIKKMSRPRVKTAIDEGENHSSRKRTRKYSIQRGKQQHRNKKREASDKITDTNGSKRESGGQVVTVYLLRSATHSGEAIALGIGVRDI